MGTRRPNPCRAATRPYAARCLLALLLVLILLLALPAASGLQPTSDSWPQFRGWDARVGTSLSNIPASNETLWSIDLTDQVQSSIAVVDGLALLGCDDGNLYCLDADTGDEVWRFETSNTVQSSPLVSDGRVYFGTSDGYGHCLDLANGTVIWSFATRQIVSSPALWNDTVYFADQWGNVWAVDADTGEEKWNETLPLDIWASPTVVAGLLYVGDIAGNFRCYDATNGDLVWNRTWQEAEIYSTAVVHNGRVLVGTGLHETLECLDAATGETIWTFNAYFEIYSSAAVSDGMVFIHSWDFLWALPWDDPNGDGVISPVEVLWDFQTFDFQGGSSPTVSGDRLVVGSDDGYLFCVESATGEPVWNLSMPDFVYGSPALAMGRVYVGSTGGRVVCVGSPAEPRLYTTIEPSQTVCEGGQSITLDISVLTIDGEPGGDAFMQYTATSGELFASFGTVVEGRFKNYWTAPDVASTTYVTITAEGELPGWDVVGDEIVITVEPAEEPPEPDLPRLAHPYLMAGVLAFVALDAVLAVLIMRGRKRQREVAA